jgi:hypothetical protein
VAPYEIRIADQIVQSRFAFVVKASTLLLRVDSYAEALAPLWQGRGSPDAGIDCDLRLYSVQGNSSIQGNLIQSTLEGSADMPSKVDIVGGIRHATISSSNEGGQW